jgi:hypothetical protein
MVSRFWKASEWVLEVFLISGMVVCFIGITSGLIAYVVFLGSAITRIWKRVEAKPYIIGCCFAIICYNTQAFVIISLPITSPMMWLLLSIGIASCNKRVEQI